jgi:hypothetical protein
MIKKLTINTNHEPDRDYLLNLTPEERISMVQQLREQYIYYFNKQDWYDASRKGLRGFCKVIKPE